MSPSEVFALPVFRHPVLRRPLAGLLVLALCLASMLGFMHRVLHLPSTVHGTTVYASASHPQAVATHARDAAVGVKALFANHTDGDLQCQLYDQLAHGCALPLVAMLVLPVVLPTAVFDFMQGEALARWVLLFDARGPPAR